MTGALNRYRNMDRDWADLADHAGAPITQPSLFIGGERDASPAWPAGALKASAETLQGLLGSHILGRMRALRPAGTPGRDEPTPARLARVPAGLIGLGLADLRSVVRRPDRSRPGGSAVCGPSA